MSSFKVIDISNYQKDIDYAKVKELNPDIKGIILRVGYTGYGVMKPMQKDARFEEHYNGFKRLGYDIGVYWYSCATTVREAEQEAALTIKYIEGKELAFPIWWDTEDDHDTLKETQAADSQATIGPKRLTDCAIAYCQAIEKAGYYVGIYASAWWFNNRLELARLKVYDKWVAHYGVDVPAVGFPYGMHQYTSSGKVGGINGNVDLNNVFKDYPSIIKKAGLNGYKKSGPVEVVDNKDMIVLHLQHIQNNVDAIKELLKGVK